MGTMLGQLQLATYAVMLGFHRRHQHGVRLSERTEWSVGEDRLHSASESLALRLKEDGHHTAMNRSSCSTCRNTPADGPSYGWKSLTVGFYPQAGSLG